MIALLRSEWLKARTTRMMLGLAIAAVGFTALNVVALIFASGQQGAPPLTDPAIVRSVFASAGSATVIILILGILGMTTEYRHMTITSTFLATPRRARVLTAKMLLYAILGVVGGVLTSVVSIGLATVLLPLREHAAVDWPVVAQIVGGVLLAFALYGVLGVAVGALIRNQIAAIIVALVWMLLVESLVVAFLPQVGKWLPGGAASGVLQSASFSGDSFLPVGWAALLMLAYAVVFALLAAATTLRRDIS